MNASSPVSARTARMFAPIVRNVDTDQPVHVAFDCNRTDDLAATIHVFHTFAHPARRVLSCAAPTSLAWTL